MTLRTNRIFRTISFFVFDAVLTYLLFFFACWASLDYSFFSGNYANLYLAGLVWAILVPLVLVASKSYRVAMSRIGLFESLKFMPFSWICFCRSFAGSLLRLTSQILKRQLMN